MASAGHARPRAKACAGVERRMFNRRRTLFDRHDSAGSFSGAVRMADRNLCQRSFRRVLRAATAAVWPIGKAKQIPQKYLKQFMLRGTGAHAGNMKAGADSLRCAFRAAEPARPRAPWLKHFDLIFCRNVLIYFDARSRARVIHQLVDHSLLPGGYLLVGYAESLTGMTKHLQYPMPTVYRRALSAALGACRHPTSGSKLGDMSTLQQPAIHVLVVDDSAVVREVLDGDIVLGTRHRSSRRQRPLDRNEQDEATTARRRRFGSRFTAHGWHHFPAKNHERGPAAGRHLFGAHRSEHEHWAAGSRGRRRGCHHQTAYRGTRVST